MVAFQSGELVEAKPFSPRKQALLIMPKAAAASNIAGANTTALTVKTI